MGCKIIAKSNNAKDMLQVDEFQIVFGEHRKDLITNHSEIKDGDRIYLADKATFDGAVIVI